MRVPHRPQETHLPLGTINKATIHRIVAGNEPVVSGGLGSRVKTHNGSDAM